MKFEIKNRWGNTIIYKGEAESFSALVVAAVAARVNLRYANLEGANLEYANLEGANLKNTSLAGVNLENANLEGARLQYANLAGANLGGCNLSGSDLSGCNLSGCNLSGCNLGYSNLRYSNLRDSNLRYSNLSGSDLSGCNLSGCNLSGTKNIPERIHAELSIVPESGSFEGWKKCQNKVLVRVLIPADARRSNATGRKCRASHVYVLDVFGGTEGHSKHDYGRTVYRIGETVKADSWTEDRWIECGHGIHFFITRKEAENY